MAQQPISTTFTTTTYSWMTSAETSPEIEQSYLQQIAEVRLPDTALQKRKLSATGFDYTQPTPIESYAVPGFLDPAFDPRGANRCYLSFIIQNTRSNPKTKEEKASNQRLSEEFIPALNRLAARKKSQEPRWNKQLTAWINQYDHYGYSPLKYAAHYGVLPAIEPLIRAGATPLRDVDRTSLHEALSNRTRHAGVTCYMILERILTTLNQTAPESLDDVINKYTIKLLRKQDKRLHLPIRPSPPKKDKTVLHALLLDKKINIREKEQVVRLLLHFGADPLLQNDQDKNAIALACELNETEETNILNDLISAVPTCDLDKIACSDMTLTEDQMKTITGTIHCRKELPTLTPFEDQPVMVDFSESAPKKSKWMPTPCTPGHYSSGQSYLVNPASITDAIAYTTTPFGIPARGPLSFPSWNALPKEDKGLLEAQGSRYSPISPASPETQTSATSYFSYGESKNRFSSAQTESMPSTSEQRPWWLSDALLVPSCEHGSLTGATLSLPLTSTVGSATTTFRQPTHTVSEAPESSSFDELNWWTTPKPT